MIDRYSNIINLETRQIIARRYHSITKIINTTYWNSDSNSDHSRYVGSYGRGTAIRTSDIDILIELPLSVFNQFENYKGNGQSYLLQSVRSALLQLYPNSKIHGDGQVIDIDFSDGILFELLPAFRNITTVEPFGDCFIYPDSNNGGTWKTTTPFIEQHAMRLLNVETNGLLFDTCKHIRSVRDSEFNVMELAGIFIDSFVYRFLSIWKYKYEKQPFAIYQSDYEKQLVNICQNFQRFKLRTPGSNNLIGWDNINALWRVLKYIEKYQPLSDRFFTSGAYIRLMC